MINPTDYVKNAASFSIKPLKDKDALAKDDGSPTHIISYKEYDRYSGEPTDKTELVNLFQLQKQRTMLQDQIDRMTAEATAVDQFLADCAKAVT